MCSLDLAVLALSIALEFVPRPWGVESSEIVFVPGVHMLPSDTTPWDRMRLDAKDLLKDADQAEARDRRLRQFHQITQMCGVKVGY